MNHPPTQNPLLLIPPSAYMARHGDRWPTHKAKRRRKQANRRTATRKVAA